MQVFGVFESRLDQIITTSTSDLSKMHLKSFFSPKQSIFSFFTLKIWSEKQLPRNTAEFLPNKMLMFKHKFISILFAVGQKNEFEK